MNRIRFLTFNLHGGRSRDGVRDLRRVNDLLDRFDIDVGIFQEMETRLAYGGALQDLDALKGPSRPHHFIGASMVEGDGWYGNLAVSRFPILQGFIHDLETRKVLEPRNAIDVLLDTPIGKMRTVGTHLSLSPFERWAEAQKLLELMCAVEASIRAPLLLMGDINEWQWPSKLLRYLDRVMTPLPCGATFPSRLPLFKLDRVWHDAPDLKITAHRLSGKDVSFLSDHLPILIEVTK